MMKINIIFFLFFLSLNSFSQSDKEERYNRLLNIIIIMESSYNEKAINKKEKAVGLLQIKHIMMQEANNIIGYEKYKLEDRLNKKKSLEIFKIIQTKYNPMYDLKKGCMLWNTGNINPKGNEGKKYWEKVERLIKTKNL